MTDQDETLKMIHAHTTVAGLNRVALIRTLQEIRNLPVAKQTA